MIVLAIDPGSDKCGIAVLMASDVLFKEVVERTDYLHCLDRLFQKYKIEQIVVGDGTGSKKLLSEIKVHYPLVPITTINEKHSTEEARTRYWKENKPRGLKCLLPTSMQLPPEPYDHYVAVILAERFMAREK